MKLEPTSYYINNTVTLKEAVTDFLHLKTPKEYDNTHKTKCRTQGGVLTDIRYSWLCRGPKLQVINTKTGTKIAAWSFGSVVHDFETYITCVTELPNAQGKLPILIVGLECEIGGGMICMFDINSCRVIRAIHVDDRVTQIHVVNPGCDTSFPGVLRAMDGVLAVGTSKGKIILIDLCRQICEEAVVNVGPEYVRDETNTCRLIYLSFFDLNNLEMHKERSLNSGDHLALQLNEASTSGVHFALHDPNGEIRLHANMEEVAISALHYCPQLGSLFTGFNFGAFQIYNLLNVQLEYTSPVYEDCIPITHFAIQEPCDDPRAFCYIWVVYNTLEDDDQGFPMAVMYALAYNTKDCLEGYGHLYQEFNSCSVRFQLELNAVPGFRLSGATGARCISLRAYTKSVINRPDVVDDKLALVSIVWCAWNKNANASETYFTLFDLNQWYKEQMPTTTRLQNDALSYMSCESLSDLDEDVSKLLDVRLDRNTINPFVCPQRLDEHYFPTALSFQAICVQVSKIVWLRNDGVQRHLLSQLESAGPLMLLRPSDLFHRCISLGLTPLYTDVLYSVSTPLNIQREMIFSVALEHQLIRWLCTCARDWSTGSQGMAGCTLDMLLDWAWQRANTLKFQSDKLCIPLFDHMGAHLDANALLQLNHCTCQIKHLATLFETVALKCTTYLGEQDVEDIKYQWRALQMISIYLEVLQWLLNVGLLPECPLAMYPRPDDSEKMSAPYPAESLARFYNARRAELNLLQSETEQKNRFIDGLNGRDLLFIDHLIDNECNGNILHKQWECDGGDGLYPPPSLQALLRTYLIEDIDIVHKHCLLIYLFLDLAMTLDQSQYKPIITHLIKFPAVFKLSPSVIKITQAFWQLDHGDFSTAMTQLLDPSINNEDLKPWHHRLVLKSLLLQGQHQHALLYQQVRKPPVSNVQDICIIITLLIVNDLLQEAFHFQRHNRSYFNEKEILKHFFTICEKMNQQSSILHLPLCPIEEKEFICYLKSNANENNKNFLVIYYLQRDRYGEAFEINDYLNNNEILKQGLLGQQDKNFRNAIVSGFRKTLPEVTQQLLDYCKKEKQEIVSNTNVKRPVPMSVCVHDTKGQTKYKSTLIQASFQKAKELWSTKQQSPNIENTLNNTPFISTPKVFKFSAERKDSSIIYPAILDSSNMDVFCDNIEEDVTPAKRMKLSPRRSINESQNLEHFKKRLSYSNSLLSTPIVKRRSIRSNESIDDGGTPTSILKVRLSPENTLRETSTTPEMNGDEISIQSNISIKSKSKTKTRTSFGVTPRKPIPRTPRPAVHFEERPNSRSSNESDHREHHQIQIDVHREQTPEIESKNSSRSTDDVFYSPNASINSSKTSESNESTERRSSLKRKANESILSRRSYKPSTPLTNIQNKSVRESLKNIEIESSPIESNIEIIVTEPEPEFEKINESIDDQIQSPTTRLRSRQSTSTSSSSKPSNQEEESPKIVPKVSGRRSLSRQVLENNLFAKVSTPRMSTRLSLTKLTDSDKMTGVEVSYTKSTTSIVKTVTDDKIEESCNIKMIEKKDEFSAEKMDENSELIIKHVHNEIETKSNVSKVTEIISDEEEPPPTSEKNTHFEEMNVLSINSDISESEASHFYQNSPHSGGRYSVLLSTPNSSKSSKTATNNGDDDDDDDDEIQEQMEIDVPPRDDAVKENSDVDEAIEEENQDIDIYEDLPEVDASNYEEIEETTPTPEKEQNESSPSSSSSSSEDSSQSSDVILIKSSSENSNSSSDKSQLLHDNNNEEIEDEDDDDVDIYESEESNDFGKQLFDVEAAEEQVDDTSNQTNTTEENFKLILDESVEKDEQLQEYDAPDDEIMQDINEDNMDEDNEFFINRDIEEMENVEFVNEASEANNIEIYETTVNESSAPEQNVIEIPDITITPEEEIEVINNPLQENVIQILDTTIKPQEVENIIEVMDATIKPQQIEESMIQNDDAETTNNPLEQNVIELNDPTTKPQEEVEESTIIENDHVEISTNPLEQNIIEIMDTTMKPQETEESIIQNDHVEIPDTTVKPQELEESGIQNDTNNPLEQNVIELNDTTIKPQELEESSIQIEDTSINPLDQNIIEVVDTPARRTRSASQSSETKKQIKTPTRTSTRRRSIDQKIEEKPEKISKKRSVSADKPEEQNIEDDQLKSVKTRTTRKKSSSVINLEIIKEVKPMSRTRRAASVDTENVNVKSRQRRGQSHEPESVPTNRGKKRTQIDLQSIPEKIEEYSLTHRLTRHQKSIMEKSLVNQEKSRLQKLNDAEQFDPIKLLDKESFTGSPDKEEGTFRAISPASSISTQSSAAVAERASPSTPKRKRGRPSLSETPGSSTHETKSPGRPRRRSFTQAQQAVMATTPTTRSGRRRVSHDQDHDHDHDQDDAVSVVSVSSVMSVPIVRLKQLTDKDVVRHRSLSPTALKEENAQKKTKRRSTRTSIVPTNLSKISEETNVEAPPTEEKPRRGGRPRKTETTQSELTGLKKSLRQSTYKPLQKYLPEHAVLKTRKSFKIRKFSRDDSP